MKYFAKTYGCQMNESDSEKIAMFLEKKGYEKAPKLEGADLIVVNACSVRQSAIDRILSLKNKFKKLRTSNPKLQTILTGCVLSADKKKFEKYFDEILTIEELLGKDYLFLQPNHLSSNKVFVPIMTGCNNFCTYCVVPYTRGKEKSRPINEIVTEIKNLIRKGYKEITLLGQNVNSYLPAGKAGKYGLAKLLKKLNVLPGNFQIKFITNHPKDLSDELINTIAKCKKIAKEIHLPIQSGDDKILKKMNRGYTIKQYKNLVKKIRKKIPDVNLSTDVIVGFPGETKKQFKNTVNLFKEIKYNAAFINKYSPRAGTAAVKLKDDISWDEKKRRWKILNDIVNSPVGRSKLIAVVGPTASGKSDLAVKIATEFSARGGSAFGGNGFEIISADSRQIYKEMNIGTGKITKREMGNIPHHCLDFASPKKQITVVEYRKKALDAINKIHKKNKTPILCGGTGFYIQAITEGIILPEVKPDQKFRKQLENKTNEALFKELKKLDPRRAKEIDSKNRKRLIRALEIIQKTGKPIPCLEKNPNWDVLCVGIKKPLPELKKLIDKRVDKMIKQGLEKEVKNLVKKYNWTQVLKNSIGYKEWNTKKPKKEIIEDIKLHTRQFAKKQMTWFSAKDRKYPANKIRWISKYQEVKKLAKDFLN